MFLVFTAIAAWAQTPDPQYNALAQQLYTAAEPARAALLAAHHDLANPSLVKAMNDLAGEVLDRRQYDSALKMYGVACDVATRVSDREGLADCTYNTGICYAGLQNSDQALEFYRRSVSIYRELGNHSKTAGGLNGQGIVLHNTGETLRADAVYQDALREAELSGDEVLVAQVNSNMGNNYHEEGNFSKAIQALEKSLEIAQRHHLELPTAKLLNNLGSVYEDQNDHDLALEYLTKSLAIKERLKNPNPADLSSSVLNIGVVYMEESSHSKAAPYFDRALELSAKGVSPSVHALTLYNYGELLRDNRQINAAKEKLTAAVDEAEKIQNRSTAANARISLAEILIDQGQYQEALDLAKAALEFARSTGEAKTRYRAAEAAGASLRSMGRNDEAVGFLDEGVRLVEDIRQQLPGDSQVAASFMDYRTSLYVRRAEIDIDANRPENALAWVERSKARALFDVLARGRADVTKSMTEGQRNRELELSRAIDRASTQMLQESHRPSPDRKRLAELNAALERAREEQRSFEIALYAEHPQLKLQRAAFEPAPCDELMASLPDPETALLEYAFGDSATYLFVATRGSGGRAELKVYKLPVKKEAVEKDVAQFRQQIATRDLDYGKLAISLYRTLMAAAEEQLRGKTTLVVVPDGELWQLPFQTLQSAPGRFVLQDHAVFYAPSLTVLREMQKLRDPAQPSQSKLLAVEAAQLSSAQREISSLRQVYGENIKIVAGADADENHIRLEAPHYQVVQLTAHGVFEDHNPMNSYLVVAKEGKPEAGMLDARSMMGLDLRADMVVLSGCETARGKGSAGEGLIGMSWALFIAGSPATVASQWKVDSDSTAELMAGFHRRLRQYSKAKALQQAELAVMKKPEYRHPFYWSGFVLVGQGF